MKKKLLPISLLCLVGMILAGCGGSKSSNSQAPASSSGAPSSVVPSSSSVTPVPSSSSVAPSSSSSAPSSSSSSSSSSSQHQPVAVTGVALDKTEASVVKGQTLQLTATVAPENADNKEVTWSSSDPDIASVKDGLVKAEDIGQATITVKTKDGNFKAECTISVIKDIQSIEITNESSFEGFIVDDMESLNVKVLPEGDPDTANTTALLASGALKASSSNTEVATVTGLTVTALKAGKTTIKVELFGKEDSFELNVGEAIPGTKYTVGDALVKGFEEAPWNGKAGGGSRITSTCFELSGLVLAVSPNGETAYNVILDDGTGAVYLQISRVKGEEMLVAPGDYAKVTCKFTNYYGLLEGVSRKAEDLKTAPMIPSKDLEKIDAPETPIAATLKDAVDMSSDEYNAYYNLCKTNGTVDAAGATYTLMKHVKLAVTYSEEASANYKYCVNDKYGLEIYGTVALDKPFEGQKSTVEVYLIGANTGKSKSNCILVEQTPLAVESVVIDQEAQTIVHGNTLQMTYTTTPAGSYSREVAWSSETEAVASIDENGLLTGLYVGEGSQSSNIKVKLGSGDDAKESPAVAISVFGETVAATAVSLDATASVYVNETVQLKATPTPAMVSDIAQWSSSDDTVATVDQKGLVKGLKEGTANITVKYNDSVSATCAVSVSWEKGVRQTDPLSVDEALALVKDEKNGYKSPKTYFIKGFVADVIENSLDKSFNNATFWLASSTAAHGFEGYRMKPIADVTNYEDFKVGAEVLLGCVIYKYNASTVENDGGNIYSISYEAHPATALALDKTSLEMGLNDEATIKTNMTPFYATDEVKWISSDSTVASVNAGKVKALAEGTATITAFIDADNDGAAGESELKASCSITVTKPADVKITSKELLGYDGSADVGYGSVPSKTIGGITLTMTDVAAYKNQSGDIQLKKTSGKIVSSLLPKKITKVVLEQSGTKNVNANVYGAETVEGLSSASAATGKNYSYSFTGNIRALMIKNNGSGAGYIKSISLYLADLDPVQIPQPIGNFSGYAVNASDNSDIFTTIALGQQKAYVEVGSLLKQTLDYSFDNSTGLVTIALGGNFGNLTATYDEANNKLTNVAVDGAAAAMLKNNGTLELNGAAKFYDCNGSTSELQAQFLRRYMSGSWQEDSSNADRLVSYENGIAGSAMQRRGWTGGAVALNLMTNIEGGVEVSNIGFWVYNPGASDVSLRQWVYKENNRFGDPKVEIGNVTAVAGQWTYCRMGFTKATIYNFQVADFNNTGIALVFDNIALF